MNGEFVRGPGQRQHSLLPLVTRFVGKESDIEKVAGRVQFSPTKRFVIGDLSQFGSRPNESAHFITQNLPQMLFDLLFERRCVPGFRIEDYIAAGNKRLDICTANTLEQTAKIIHLHGVAANINRAQKGYVLWHLKKSMAVKRRTDLCQSNTPATPAASDGPEATRGFW